ncbi:hypothetical protein M9458_006106, partial [Cirrhinus mrigala]
TLGFKILCTLRHVLSEVIFHGVPVNKIIRARTTARISSPNPLQSFSRFLSYPVHPVVCHCKTRCFTGDLHCFSRSLYLS